MSIYAKEFLVVNFAFDTFAHILGGTTEPVLVLTDNKSITMFFQAKTIPSSLWTCVDHVLNFKCLLGQIPGKANEAADYLSRIHSQPHTKLELKFVSKIPVADVHLNMGMQVPDNSVNLLKVECESSMSSEDLKDLLKILEGSFIPSINALDAPIL